MQLPQETTHERSLIASSANYHLTPHLHHHGDMFLRRVIVSAGKYGVGGGDGVVGLVGGE